MKVKIIVAVSAVALVGYIGLVIVLAGVILSHVTSLPTFG
jgi:hypothetical protein